MFLYNGFVMLTMLSQWVNAICKCFIAFCLLLSPPRVRYVCKAIPPFIFPRGADQDRTMLLYQLLHKARLYHLMHLFYSQVLMHCYSLSPTSLQALVE